MKMRFQISYKYEYNFSEILLSSKWQHAVDASTRDDYGCKFSFYGLNFNDMWWQKIELVKDL
jgi:hypothetical protein